MTPPKESKIRADKLRKEIRRHSHLYYVLDRPEISDAAFDKLLRELVELEKAWPALVTPDSPTQRVGSKPTKGRFATRPHTVPKMSLQDAFSFDELREWEARLGKLLPQKSWSYFAEPKIDGLNITIAYKHSVFAYALTRGDGFHGEDVSHTVRTIRSIPLTINANDDLEVSGEIYLPKKSFTALNREQEKIGETPFANPRNAAAGSIRQLDPKVAAKRNLDAIFYDIQGAGLPLIKTRAEIDQYLRKLGFKTGKYVRLCKNMKDVIAYCKEMDGQRHNFPYATDGAVVKVNQNSLYSMLGSTAKSPRWAIAFKFPPEAAVTKVLNITVQVGRTGALTPVAILKPVHLSGSVVARATLHNEEEIERKDVRIGDTVTVHKAGEIIPEVLEVDKKKRPAHAKKFSMPSKCPVCGGATSKPTGEAIRRCNNSECRQQQICLFKHFVSRAAFDIEGLGPKLLAKLIDEGIIKTPADLFRLKESDLVNLERLAEKSASNIIAAIQAAKEIDLGRFLYALGIRHVGEQTANDLAKFLQSRSKTGRIDLLKTLPIQEISKVKGIGPIVAESIRKWFLVPKNQQLLQDLPANGIRIASAPNTKENKMIAGKTFVFTGTMEFIDRSKAEELVRKLGGKASSSVGKNTDYIVTGSNPGSKLEKAKKLGISILNEREFKKLISF